ncbi:MAG: hypothetical protein GEV11_22935 [Streptosporangiales bacterium]|nr:hypothetical protein [Streptosporangiales bacterium]
MTKPHADAMELRPRRARVFARALVPVLVAGAAGAGILGWFYGWRVAAIFGVAVVLVLGYTALRVTLLTRNPPRLSPRGLELKAWSRYRRDVLLPWSQIRRIRIEGSGAQRVLLVKPRDMSALAGGDTRRLEGLRRQHERYGAPLVVLLGDVADDTAAIAEAVHRYGGGQVRPELPGHTPRRRRG